LFNCPDFPPAGSTPADAETRSSSRELERRREEGILLAGRALASQPVGGALQDDHGDLLELAVMNRPMPTFTKTVLIPIACPALTRTLSAVERCRRAEVGRGFCRV